MSGSKKVVLCIDKMPELDSRIKSRFGRICNTRTCDYGEAIREIEREATDRRKEMEQKSTSYRLDPVIASF